jgi:tyrosyl-tRNA synthetase
MSTFLEELKWRGLLYQATPGVEKQLEQPTTFYWGIDPTGDSLHVGHFMGVVMYKRALQFGYKVILLAGGGTSMIGDPGGKDEERPILPKEIINKNKEKIKKQLLKFFHVDDSKVTLVDNAEWLEKISLVDFLRDAGKYVTVNSMIDKDSVATRITREHGISYAEFSYQLLQAYDFLELYQKYDCKVQVAGSDQWGNMVQGIELIRKRLNKDAYALSWPLIVNPKTGKKFGKTEKGAAIWLDPEKTHPFEFYQFFVNTDDEMTPTLMKYFSFKTKDEIAELERQWAEKKETRSLQKELAYELTEMVHGTEIAEKAKKVASILFEKGTDSLTLEDMVFVKTALPYKEIISKDSFNLEESLVETGLLPSKSEARRLIQQNGVKVEELFGKYFLIKKGKKDYAVVEVIE